MQIFAVAVFVIVCVCALFDFKRTVLIWMPVQFLFNNQIAVRYATPSFNVYEAVNLALFAIYWIKCYGREKERHLNGEPYLFLPLCLLSFLSYLFSTILAIIPFTTSAIATIRYFMLSCCVLYIYQRVLNDEHDIRLCVRSCAVVISLMTLLGLYESIMHDNPWLDIVYLTSPQNESTYGRMWYVPPFISESGDLQMRFGLVRAYSFAGIHIAYGTACVFFSYLVFTALKNKWQLGLSQKQWIVLAILLASGVFCANSKTGMVGYVFLLLAFVKIKYLSRPIVFIPVVAAIVILLFYVPEFLKNYYSLFDENLAVEGGGSSIAMRQHQYVIVKRLFEMNPIFGNGIGSIKIMKQKAGFEDILGAESSLFKILPERGIFGLLVYLYAYFFYFKIMRQYVPLRETVFFLLALFVMEAATGTMDITRYGLFIILVRSCYKNANALLQNDKNSIGNDKFIATS